MMWPSSLPLPTRLIFIVYLRALMAGGFRGLASGGTVKLWTVRGTDQHEEAVSSFLDGYGYLILGGELIELLNVCEQTEDAWCWRIEPVEYEGEA